MNTELAIIKQENILQIVSAVPQAYASNTTSHDKCIEAGQHLLSLIEQNGGKLTDEFDQQAAVYIEKARKTVKKMNEFRAPVTKLFDEVRTAFTRIENNIDPTKPNTIPAKLQQLRNSYAAQKRAEEEARQRQEAARQMAERERQQYMLDVEVDLKKQFQCMLNQRLDQQRQTDSSITLDNYDTALNHIKNTPTQLEEEWLANLRTNIVLPQALNTTEAQNIERSILQKLYPQFKEEYTNITSELQTYILDRLPSKRANLERIAKANQEEAARLEAEMKQKEQQEAARLEAERKQRMETECRQAEIKKQATEVGNLFAEQAAIEEYQPKTKITKKIHLLNPEGVLSIISMWWSKEGCTLTTDELHKIFKKQITLCEKLANKEGEYIKDESVEYINEVKAK